MKTVPILRQFANIMVAAMFLLGGCTKTLVKDDVHQTVTSGGVFESVDKGADWKPLNVGVAADFLPIPNPEYGHDTHCMRLHLLRIRYQLAPSVPTREDQLTPVARRFAGAV